MAEYINTKRAEQVEPTLRQDPRSRQLHRMPDDATIRGQRVQVQQVIRGERFLGGKVSEQRDNLGIGVKRTLVMARSGNQDPASSGMDPDGIESAVALAGDQGLAGEVPGERPLLLIGMALLAGMFAYKAISRS